MVFDLPAAYVGCAAATALVRRHRRPGVLHVLAEGRARAALERERRTTMALALRELPTGTCVAGRDACGREWFIGPAVITRVRESEEVVH
jgi:hypothetical protein